MKRVTRALNSFRISRAFFVHHFIYLCFYILLCAFGSIYIHFLTTLSPLHTKLLSHSSLQQPLPDHRPLRFKVQMRPRCLQPLHLYHLLLQKQLMRLARLIKRTMLEIASQGLQVLAEEEGRRREIEVGVRKT